MDSIYLSLRAQVATVGTFFMKSPVPFYFYLFHIMSLLNISACLLSNIKVLRGIRYKKYINYLYILFHYQNITVDVTVNNVVEKSNQCKFNIELVLENIFCTDLERCC